ncbi:hypothetical protein ACROYT_G019426 [Oculina patagonica]
MDRNPPITITENCPLFPHRSFCVSQTQTTMSQKQQKAKLSSTKKSSRSPTTTTAISANEPSTSKEPHGTEPPSPQPVSDSPVNSPTTPTRKQLSTPATAPSTERTLIAYVQQLSPPQRNKRNTMDYAKLFLQTGNDTSQEALLYSRANSRKQ